MTVMVQSAQRSRHLREGPYDTSATALVRRQWRWFVTIVALSLVTGVGLFYSMEPEYTARADLVVIAGGEVPAPSASESPQVSVVSSNVSMDSVAHLLLSDRVVGHVARSINYPGGKEQLRNDIQISPVINSRIFRIFIRNSSAKVALKAASGLAERLFEQRLQSLTEETAGHKIQLQALLGAIDQEMKKPSLIRPDVRDEDSGTLEESELLTHRQEIISQLASLSVNSPEAGYILRPAELPKRSSRSGFFVFFGSALAIGAVTASAACSWRERRYTPN